MQYSRTASSASKSEASSDNEISAMQIRQTLTAARILSVAMIGPPGAGKTALLEATARQLRGEKGVLIIVANPAADRDVERLSRYCDHVRPINTAVPTAEAVRAVLGSAPLDEIDIVFIESVGGITGAPELGQDLTVAVLAVTGGDDKYAEYANLVR